MVKAKHDGSVAKRKKVDLITVKTGDFKLAEVKGTGNGYHVRFQSGSSAVQDDLLSIDFSNAHSLWLALCLEFGLPKFKGVVVEGDQ